MNEFIQQHDEAYLLTEQIIMNQQQLIGPLFYDSQVLQHILVRHSCLGPQHVVNRGTITVDLVEQGINTWNQINQSNQSIK